ncbi:Cyclin-like F-box [Cordyceps militaris CM01]|uniref:Cyclin-like F-box n=1 Tax=Cordyceps militaris (strain CM01) TaxID=983644 RepID=G3JSM1_CORMM|nr:Cyclin-like F-box [Cordyceps militaris CM01]EGX88867.1 Cyclin-like F-box [Cordyceps militaris CM01]
MPTSKKLKRDLSASPETNGTDASQNPLSKHPPELLNLKCAPKSKKLKTQDSSASPETNGSDLLLQLPRELRDPIFAELPLKDIKNLRQSSKTANEMTSFRIFRRVFLSRNPRNIEVFLQIANHKHYRLQVEEIVLDEAFLTEYSDQTRDRFQRGREVNIRARRRRADEIPPTRDSGKEATAVCEAQRLLIQDKKQDTEKNKGNEEKEEGQKSAAEKQRAWVALVKEATAVCEAQRLLFQDKKQDTEKNKGNEEGQESAADIEQRDWAFYQGLLKEQTSIYYEHGEEFDQDYVALRHGLAHFTNLKAIIITSNAHGQLFMPEYQTPIMRKFPPDFNYPLPASNMCGKAHKKNQHWPTAARVDASPGEVAPLPFAYPPKSQWNGLCKVIEALDALPENHKLTKLVVGISQVEMGVEPKWIARRSPFYEKFIKLISRPQFRELGLMLEITQTEYERLQQLLTRYEEATQMGEVPRELMAWEVIAAVPHIESLSLRQMPCTAEASSLCLPLQLIFPRFTHLKYLRLWSFTATTLDLIDFLSGMPKSLKRVDLVDTLPAYAHSASENLDPQELLRGMLEVMKAKSLWKTWPANARPNLRIARCLGFAPYYQHCFKTEVDAFLHGDGPNPFRGSEDGDPLSPRTDEVKGVIRGTRYPSFEILASCIRPEWLARLWAGQDLRGLNGSSDDDLSETTDATVSKSVKYPVTDGQGNGERCVGAPRWSRAGSPRADSDREAPSKSLVATSRFQMPVTASS